MNIPSPTARTALIAAVLTTLTGAALAATPDRPTAPARNDASRPCEGRVTTLAWGAYVSDTRGRCAPQSGRVAAADTLTVRVDPPQAVVARPETCANERRWLGGAVRICRDSADRDGAR